MSNDALKQMNYPDPKQRKLHAVSKACRKAKTLRMKLFWKNIELKIK